MPASQRERDLEATERRIEVRNKVNSVLSRMQTFSVNLTSDTADPKSRGERASTLKSIDSEVCHYVILHYFCLKKQ